MSKTRTDDAAGLTVADVIHKRFTALPASATIGEVSDWFAASASRRMAILADDGRYAGSLTPADVTGDVDRTRPATEVAKDGPTIGPDAPAPAGEERALSTDARRVPVVDRTRPATEVAKDGPTIGPDAPARAGEERALLTDARRVPVVDRDRRLLGIVSVTGDLTSFCGTD